MAMPREHQNETQLQHLVSISLVQGNQLYKHMITSPEESTGDTVSIWTLFSHTGVYVMAIVCLYQQDWGYFTVISFGANLPD